MLRISAISQNQLNTIILLRLICRQSGFAWQQGGYGGIEQLQALGIAAAVRVVAHGQFPVTAADRAIAHRVGQAQHLQGLAALIVTAQQGPEVLQQDIHFGFACLLQVSQVEVIGTQRVGSVQLLWMIGTRLGLQANPEGADRKPALTGLEQGLLELVQAVKQDEMLPKQDNRIRAVTLELW